MTKDEIMALADAYADHAYNDGVLRLDHADDRTAASRAALEAALTEKQEPVAWELRKGKTDRVLIDITNNPEIAHNWKASLEEVVPLYNHPAPVNQALLEALNEDLYRQGVVFIDRITKLEQALDVALEALEIDQSEGVTLAEERAIKAAINLLKEVRRD